VFVKSCERKIKTIVSSGGSGDRYQNKQYTPLGPEQIHDVGYSFFTVMFTGRYKPDSDPTIEDRP
jgi:hypothetical protein